MRPDIDQYLLAIAKVTATRATCPKRAVGAVVADMGHRIVGTGYNGVPAGLPHCTDKPCSGVGLAAPKSHQHCNAVHAEVNAILVAGHQARGGTLAVTTSPCKECAKVIINAGIRRLVFAEQNRLWDAADEYGTTPKDLLQMAGVHWTFYAD